MQKMTRNQISSENTLQIVVGLHCPEEHCIAQRFHLYCTRDLKGVLSNSPTLLVLKYLKRNKKTQIRQSLTLAKGIEL